MKQLLICLLMTSFLANIGYSAETTTECPMMREANERYNPKANLAAMKPKPKRTRGAVSIQ